MVCPYLHPCSTARSLYLKRGQQTVVMYQQQVREAEVRSHLTYRALAITRQSFELWSHCAGVRLPIERTCKRRALPVHGRNKYCMPSLIESPSPVSCTRSCERISARRIRARLVLPDDERASCPDVTPEELRAQLVLSSCSFPSFCVLGCAHRHRTFLGCDRRSSS